MTRHEAIKKIEEIQRLLQEEVDLELTDYAREQAYFCLVGAVQYLEENEERN